MLLLWAAPALLSPLFLSCGAFFAVAWEEDVGSRRRRWLEGILGRPSGYFGLRYIITDFELGWEGGALFKV